MLFPRGIGIDISDTHVRLAWMTHSGEVELLKEVGLPPGLIIDDAVSKPKLLKTQLESLLEEEDVKDLKGNITIAVPGSRIFLANFWTEKGMKHTEAEELAIQEGQKRIPFSLSDGLLDLEFGAEEKEKIATALVAAEKKIVKDIEEVFHVFELPIVAIESRSEAIHRLIHENSGEDLKKKMKLIVDFGATWANLTLFDTGGLPVFSRAVRLNAKTKKGAYKKRLSTAEMEEVCGIIKETIQFLGDFDKDPIALFVTGEREVSKKTFDSCKKSLKKIDVNRMEDVINVEGAKQSEASHFSACIGAAMRSIKPRRFNKIHNFKTPITYES